MKYRAKNLKKLFQPCSDCSARRIFHETQLVDKIQRLIEYGDSRVFSSFKVRLESEAAS